MSHSYCNCLMHYAFSTQHRENRIAAELRPRLWAYMGGIARENGMTAMAVGGTANHAHLLLSIPAAMSPAKAAQLVKGGSSKWIHDTFPEQGAFAWQEGYGAFSIGISGVEQTVRYIETQEQHHHTRSFEDEFVAFLQRHHLQYDEAQIRA